MNTNYSFNQLCLWVIIFVFGVVPSGQSQVIITGIVDGTLTGATPRVIELYINGSMDLSQYRLERAPNSQDFFDQSLVLNGLYEDQFVYLVNSSSAFISAFGSARDFKNTIENSGIISGNGNDAFRIVRLADSQIIDQVAPHLDDTNLYTDSYMYRKNNTGPDAGWISANWDFGGNNLLDGMSATQIGTQVPLGSYIYLPTGKQAFVRLSKTAQEPNTNGSFTISLSENAPMGGIVITYSLTGTATVDEDYSDPLNGIVNISENSSSQELPIIIQDDELIDPGESIIISLISATGGFGVSDVSQIMTIVENDIGSIPIYTLQGRESASIFNGNRVTTSGVVTESYTGTNQLRGFFLQDITGVNDPQTSDGLFIFCDRDCPEVQQGDEVEVSGSIVENDSRTELRSLTNTIVISSGNTLPNPINIELSLTDNDFESVEGMLVNVLQKLAVTDNFNAGRFGEITLSLDSILIQPTETIDPNDQPSSGNNSFGIFNVGAILAQQGANENNRLILDDGKSNQNPIILPSFFSQEKSIRLGSSVQNLVGILHYNFDSYRVESLSESHPHFSQNFSYATRPDVPLFADADVIVSAFNIENYFNGDGLGEGFLSNRGAHSLEEFNRQRDKIIQAIVAMNSDVLGIIELERDGVGSNSSLHNIVDGINEALGEEVYRFIDDDHIAHADFIRNAIIYKPKCVIPQGQLNTSTNSVFSREPITQKFLLLADTSKSFVVSVNHFKSKGGCPNEASNINADQGDGQGCFNNRRKDQSSALISFLDENYSGDNILIIGDLNSYSQEDPIDLLREAGYSDRTIGLNSFIFMGQSGSLDHALVKIKDPLSLTITGSKWGINHQEPRALNYEDSNQEELFFVSPFRSSDHDPVMIGLDFKDIVLSQGPLLFSATQVGENTASLEWQSADAIVIEFFILEYSTDSLVFIELAQIDPVNNSQRDFSFSHEVVLSENNYYRLKQFSLNSKPTQSETLHLAIQSNKIDVEVINTIVEDDLLLNITGSNQENYKYQIFDHLGRHLLSGQIDSFTPNISLFNLTPGIYLLVIEGNSLVIEQKIVKH